MSSTAIVLSVNEISGDFVIEDILNTDDENFKISTILEERFDKDPDKFLKMFLEAGGIPDHATNPKDFEILQGLYNCFIFGKGFHDKQI